MKDECYQFIKNSLGKPSIVGFGSYGEVKIARCSSSGETVAIKLIHGKNAKYEIDVHHTLDHPNIIKLLNYYYEKEKNLTYMVLEFAENGSLNDKIKFNIGFLSKEKIKRYFQQICQAVQYLHSHNFMHRDIKPENVLITKGDIAKLCDFGFAAILSSRTTICGTFEYMAPEMIKKKYYNHKIDIWALGIMLFEMIQGLAPFRGETGQQVIAEMKKPIKFSNRFESVEIDLIKKILRVNPDNRPTVEQILKHPYFEADGNKKLETEGDSSQEMSLQNSLEFDRKDEKKSLSPHRVKPSDNQGQSSKSQLKRFLKKNYKEENKGEVMGKQNSPSVELVLQKTRAKVHKFENVKTQPSIVESQYEEVTHHRIGEQNIEDVLEINSSKGSKVDNLSKSQQGKMKDLADSSKSNLSNIQKTNGPRHEKIQRKEFRKYSRNFPQQDNTEKKFTNENKKEPRKVVQGNQKDGKQKSKMSFFVPFSTETRIKMEKFSSKNFNGSTLSRKPQKSPTLNGHSMYQQVNSGNNMSKSQTKFTPLQKTQKPTSPSSSMLRKNQYQNQSISSYQIQKLNTNKVQQTELEYEINPLQRNKTNEFFNIQSRANTLADQDGFQDEKQLQKVINQVNGLQSAVSNGVSKGGSGSGSLNSTLSNHSTSNYRVGFMPRQHTNSQKVEFFNQTYTSGTSSTTGTNYQMVGENTNNSQTRNYPNMQNTYASNNNNSQFLGGNIQKRYQNSGQQFSVPGASSYLQPQVKKL